MTGQASSVTAFLAADEATMITVRTTSGARCPSCHEPLELHQPDETRPERLLGVCPECHDWSLVSFTHRGRVKLTSVPDTW